VTPATTNLPRRLKACRGVLVDSNVLLDVATNDPTWGEWSARVLAEVAEHASLTINPIVYAEVSIGYTTIEALEAAIPAALYRREPLPREAAFLAGKCFVNTGGAEVYGTRLCLISTSERTQPSAGLPCSRAMPPGIEAISPESRSLPQLNAEFSLRKGKIGGEKVVNWNIRTLAVREVICRSPWPL